MGIGVMGGRDENRSDGRIEREESDGRMGEGLK